MLPDDGDNAVSVFLELLWFSIISLDVAKQIAMVSGYGNEAVGYDDEAMQGVGEKTS